MKFYFLLVLVLLLNMLPLRGDDSVLTDDRENWSTMIDELHHSLSGRTTLDLVKYRESVESRLDEFSRICEETDKRISELDFLLWMQPDDAILGISISVYNRQIADLNIYFDAKLNSIVSSRESLESEIKRFSRLRTMLEKVKLKYFTTKQLADKEASHKKLQQIITELEQIAALMDTRLKAADEIQKNIAAVMASGKKRNNEVFDKMLFNPQSDIVSSFASLRLSFYFWFRDIWNNIWIQVPETKEFWLKFMGMAVLVGSLFMLLGRLLYSKLQKFKIISEHNSKFIVFTPGWICLGAALTMFGTYFWTTVIEYSFFCRLAMIFISIAFLLFNLRIRLKPEFYPNAFKLYLPLLLLYIFGSMLWTLVVTYRPLIFIWTVVNIPVAAATGYYMFKYKLPVLDRLLGFITVLLTLGCAVLAAYGYAFIAITAIMIWFLAAVGIQTGIALTSLASRFNPETTSQKIAASFVFMILIPMKWILIIGGLIYWTATQFNVQNLLEKFLESNLCPGVQFIQISIWDIICSLAAALILFFTISTVKNVIRLFYSENADSGLLASFLTLGTYLAWIGYTVFVLMLMRVPPNSVLVVLGGMSMGLGFGLRDIIENFICGIVLLAGKSVRPGDTIEFDGTWGVVQKISIRSTVVKTFDDAIINLPNSVVVSKNFRNWTLTGNIIRRDIKVDVSKDSDVARVKSMLLEIAAKDSNVLMHPPPRVLFMDMGGGKLDFCLRLWFKDLRKNTDSESRIREEIERQFKENNVVIV